MAEDQDPTPSRPAPPIVSPDGRFWWNGTDWQPFAAQPDAPAAAPSPTVGAVRSRSPFGAAVMSLVVPGAGHLYAGQVAWSAMMFFVGAWGVYFASSNLDQRTIDTNPIQSLIGVVVALIIWTYVAVDAYRATRDWNKEHGVTS